MPPYIIILLLLLLHADTLPNKGQIRTDNIKSGSELFVLFIEDKDTVQNFVSFLEKKITIAEEVITVTQHHFNTNGTSDFDSSTVRQRDLNPLSYTSILNDGTHSERFVFKNNRVEGVVSEKGQEQNISESYPAKEVFNAVIQDELLKSFSFQDQKRYPLMLYNPGKSFMEVSFNLTGIDTLKLESLQIPALKIEMDGALLPTTIWLDSKDQGVIQQRTRLPDGRLFWKRKVI
jgi:hypothetical protein